MRILISPNSFKECSDSVEISALFEKNFNKIFASHNISGVEIITKPVSDGGDGFLPVCKSNFNTEEISFKLPGLISGSRIECPIQYAKKSQTIYIESANIFGLKTIKPDERNPLKFNTRGLGVLLKKLSAEEFLIRYPVKEVIIGIGGTATNDLGIGAVSEFGMELFDRNSKELLPLPENFIKAEKLDFKKLKLPFKLKVIEDVNNPLTGENGAARIYSPQKGAGDKEVELFENGTKKIIKLLGLNKTEINKLSGAGGGVAAGLKLFFDAESVTSNEFILNYLNINRQIRPDFVITGEGSFDEQSMFSKAASVIINEFKDIGKILICAGKISGDYVNLNDQNIELFELVRYFKSKEDSIKNIREGIEKASEYFINIILKSGAK